jgi:hypothetical protein
MKPRSRLAVIVAGVVISTLTMLGAVTGAANAADERGSGAARATSTVVRSGTVTVAAADEAVCTLPISRYGHQGRFLCNTHVMDVTWPDGHGETFIIGGDASVWHITATFADWRSMGGLATDTWDAFVVEGWPTVQVYVAWSRYNFWCSSYVLGGWTSWDPC